MTADVDGETDDPSPSAEKSLVSPRRSGDGNGPTPVGLGGLSFVSMRGIPELDAGRSELPEDKPKNRDLPNDAFTLCWPNELRLRREVTGFWGKIRSPND